MSSNHALLSPSYCKIDNFGDKLNQVFAEEIFTKSFGPLFDVRPESTPISIYAIGSYLSHEFLKALTPQRSGVILGMGAGYGDLLVKQSFGFRQDFPVRIKNNLSIPLPKGTLSKSACYYIGWVRGPLTARLLGLSECLAIADAGYLIRRTSLNSSGQQLNQSYVGFMPHYTAAVSSPYLQRICEDLGFLYIDPRSSVEAVVNRIKQCKYIMTEALHGAIVSDALRVGWIPVRSSKDIFEFKWQDYCSSIGLEYKPYEISVSWQRRHWSGRKSVVKYLTTSARSCLSRLLVNERDTALSLLYASAQKPLLTCNKTIAEIDERLEDKIDQCSIDLRAGKLGH